MWEPAIQTVGTRNYMNSIPLKDFYGVRTLNYQYRALLYEIDR
jgi:hypothetical protein